MPVIFVVSLLNSYVSFHRIIKFGQQWKLLLYR